MSCSFCHVIQHYCWTKSARQYIGYHAIIYYNLFNYIIPKRKSKREIIIDLHDAVRSDFENMQKTSKLRKNWPLDLSVFYKDEDFFDLFIYAFAR